MATTLNTEFFADTFKTMTESFTDTMRTAMKFNEDTARFWTDTFSKNSEEFRTRSHKIADEVTPFSKQNVERFQRTFDEQMNRTVNFMRDAFGAMQPAKPTEVTDRMLSMWKESFENVRESMDTYAKANMDMFKTWTEFYQTAANGAGKTVKAAKAGA